MPRFRVAGVCHACDGRFTGQQIRKHLAKCPKRAAGDASAFDVRVSADPYWAFLEMPASATLEHLDAALRQLWVECCGHLSRFTISGALHASYSGLAVDLNKSSGAEVIAAPGTPFAILVADPHNGLFAVHPSIHSRLIRRIAREASNAPLRDDGPTRSPV